MRLPTTVGQPDVHEQNCEICGLLIHHLEVIIHRSSWRPQQHLQKASEQSTWVSRGDAPADLVQSMDEFLTSACKPAVIGRIRLCSSNGDDTSHIRNPKGVQFDNESCRVRLQERCNHVAPAHAAQLMEAALNNLTAVACTGIIPSPACGARRATLLLGPLYRSINDPWKLSLTLNAGVKDVWRKYPGYYHNAARHETLETPPRGWDPDGPEEQVIQLDDSASGKRDKDEL